jgi:type I restriction enzyme, S subunit
MNQITELTPLIMVDALRPSDWQSGELLDFLELQRGVDLPVQDRRGGDVPIFGSNGLLGFHNTSVSEGPGVITGRSGTIGKVFYTECKYWPLNTALYVKNFKGNLPKFVYYKLGAIGLERFSTGTGVPTLNRNVAHKETVAFPPLPEQKKSPQSSRPWTTSWTSSPARLKPPRPSSVG